MRLKVLNSYSDMVGGITGCLFTFLLIFLIKTKTTKELQPYSRILTLNCLIDLVYNVNLVVVSMVRQISDFSIVKNNSRQGFLQGKLGLNQGRLGLTSGHTRPDLEQTGPDLGHLILRQIRPDPGQTELDSGQTRPDPEQIRPSLEKLDLPQNRLSFDLFDLYFFQKLEIRLGVAIVINEGFTGSLDPLYTNMIELFILYYVYSMSIPFFFRYVLFCRYQFFYDSQRFGLNPRKNHLIIFFNKRIF